jgi:hypothetical protein
MRNLIRKRLTEYRIHALDNIAVAVNNTKANFAKHGALGHRRRVLFGAIFPTRRVMMSRGPRCGMHDMGTPHH